MISLSLLGQCDFSFGYLHGLLRKPIGQDKCVRSEEKSQKPDRIASRLNPDFPEILSAGHLLEVLRGNALNVFDEPQNPCDLLCVLARK